jgi:hypothetical protein
MPVFIDINNAHLEAVSRIPRELPNKVWHWQRGRCRRLGRRRVGASFRGWEVPVRRDVCPAGGRPSRASYSACEPIQKHTMSPSSASTAMAR